MKTVLEELIEEMDWHYHAAEKEYLENKSSLSYTAFRTYDFCLKMASALLEKEKEQMFECIKFGTGVRSVMEEIVHDKISNSLKELVKQGKLKDYRNYKSK